MKKQFLLFTTIISFFSCEKPCQEASTGPPSFAVELIDKTTLNNVFTSGIFLPSQLQVVDNDNNILSFKLDSENNRNVVSITPAWQGGVFKIFIKLNNTVTIPIFVFNEAVSDRCNSNVFHRNIQVEGFDFTKNNQVGYYQIKI